MSLFNKYKRNCKRRCRSWFSGLPDVERACINRCRTGNTEFARDEFLCGGEGLDERQIILAYGFDPCPDNATTFEDAVDPLGERAQAGIDLRQYQDVFVVLGALIVLGLVTLVVIIK